MALGSTNTLSMQKADTAHDGYLAAADWNAFNSKQSVLTAGTGISLAGGVVANTGVTTVTAGGGVTVSSSSGAVTLGTSAGGDLSGALNAATVAGLEGKALPALGTGGLLRYNGSAWAWDSNTYATGGPFLGLAGGTMTGGVTMAGANSFAAGAALTVPIVASVPGTCIAGQIFYVTSTASFYGCSGTTAVVLNGTPYGDTAANPGLSCNAIHIARPSAADGSYWITANGAASPFQVVCDMTTDGGGWTRIRTLSLPLMAAWTSLGAVPFANPLPANPTYTRFMAALQLDSSKAWASWDVGGSMPDGAAAEIQFTGVTKLAGMTNGHYGINTTTATVPSTLYFNSWTNCYGTGAGAPNSRYDVVDNVPSTAVCYAQYAFAAGQTSIIFAYNHWAQSGNNDDVGIGTNPSWSTSGQNYDWTFAYNAASYTTRQLTWWVR